MKKIINKSVTISLCLGIASIFLWEFSIIPILAVVFGMIGFIRDKKNWEAWIGITLGIIFIIVRISSGYIDRGVSLNSSLNDGAAQISSEVQPSISPPTSLTLPTPLISESTKNPAPSLAPTVSQNRLNTEKNKELTLQLISPLLNKYSFLIKSIEIQLPYWESLNQKYTSIIANLQRLQSVTWRNDVQGVVDQLLDEKDLLSKYVDLAKGRQGYADGMKEGLDSAYKEFGGEPFDNKFTKHINDSISEIDGWILEYDMNSPDSVTATLRARDSKIDILVKALFYRLQNT